MSLKPWYKVVTPTSRACGGAGGEKPEAVETREKKGFNQEVFEEEWRPVKVRLAELDPRVHPTQSLHAGAGRGAARSGRRPAAAAGRRRREEVTPPRRAPGRVEGRRGAQRLTTWCGGAAWANVPKAAATCFDGSGGCSA